MYGMKIRKENLKMNKTPAGTFSYLSNGKQVFIPETNIKNINVLPGCRIESLKEYKDALAVFVAEVCIGWIFKENLPC
jgi:hypothetical protein